MSKYIAIDLDPQGIFAVGGSSRLGHAKVDAVLAWDGTDGEPPPALTLETAKRIGEELQARLRSAGASPGPALITVPRDRVILKELRYPVVPPVEEPSIVRFQAMKELTDAPDDLVIDYVPLSGAPEGERRSMAFAVRKELYSAIQALCAAANLKLAGVTPRPYGVAAGLSRAFATGAAPRPAEKAPVAVLTLGPAGGEFTVFRPGASAAVNEIIFTRTVAAPALSSENMLLAEVRRNLTMYAGANPAAPIDALYVADTDGRWINRLKNALGLPVHDYDPLAGFTSAAPESSRGRFAPAVGMLAAIAAGDLPINFATPRQPKVEKDPVQKQLLLAAAGVLLLVVGVLGAGMMWVSVAEQNLADLKKKKTDLENEANTLDPDFKRYQAVKQWRSRSVVWLDMLYDLTDQFQHTDEMAAISFTAKSIPPDSKTGKQEAQATIDIRLTSHSSNPVSFITAAMEAENPEQKTHRDTVVKYYHSVFTSPTGPAAGDPNAKEYMIRARVNGRPPEAFTRFRSFPPPARWGYPPPVATSKDKDKDKDKDDKDAEEGP